MARPQAMTLFPKLLLAYALKLNTAPLLPSRYSNVRAAACGEPRSRRSISTAPIACLGTAIRASMYSGLTDRARYQSACSDKRGRSTAREVGTASGAGDRVIRLERPGTLALNKGQSAPGFGIRCESIRPDTQWVGPHVTSVLGGDDRHRPANRLVTLSRGNSDR